MKIDMVGKIGLSAFLQMPGTARSSPSEMFNDNNYDLIFGDKVSVEVIKDSKKLLYYYDNYKKRITKEGTDSGFKPVTINIIKNGAMYVLSCFAYIAKISQGVFNHKDIIVLKEDTDDLKQKIKHSNGMKGLFDNSFSETKIQDLTNVFAIIADDIIAVAYDKSKKSSDNETNWLKSDSNYYKYVLDELWKTYKQNDKFNKLLCGLVKK